MRFVTDQNFARREAHPILWTDLSDDQRGAIEQAARILADLAKPSEDRGAGKKETHLDLFLPAIDDKRLNHVVLLDGDRGSGKTAVLITLLDAWNRMLRGQVKPEHQPLVNALQRTDRIVPIGLIDLQPLPKSTNLLLYLVGRFQRVVEAIEQVHTERGSHTKRAGDRRQPWQGVSPEEPASTAKWRDFVHAAALGWNGNIVQRRGSLDPETFVVELEQTEKRRLDVVSSFRALVDALVEEYPRLNAKPSDHPLFLLAIDDADTNPEKAEELLDLVRTLWHPRVAFLLTGDSNLFLAILRNRTTKSLGDPKDPGVVKFGNDLAIDIYNKAIPPVHRCRFYRLPPKDRLTRLEKHLKKISDLPAPLKNSFDSLFDVFAANEQVQEALPSRERSIADLQNRIEHEANVGGAGHQAMRNVVAALCRSAFASGHDNPGEHIPHFKPEEDLRDAARTVRDWSFDVSNKNTLLLRNDEQDPHWNLIVQRHPRWEIADAKGHVVSNEKMAAGMLARDVVASSFQQRESLPPIKPLGLLGAGVRVEFSEENEVSYFAWPLPDWPTFGDYFKFGRDWANHVPKPETYDVNHVDVLAFHFLRIVVALLGGSAPAVTNAKPEWDKLAAEVAKLAANEKAETVHWALARAGLWAAPESGLSDTAANQWLEALQAAFDTKWEDVRQALRKERIARGRVVARDASRKAQKTQGVGPKLSAIDKKYEKYKWYELVESEQIQPAAANASLEPLFEALKTIPTPWWPRRPNLASYFDLQSRKIALTGTTSRERVNALMAAIEPYKGREGMAAEAMVKLWEAECKILGVGSEDIEARDGRIVAPSLDGLTPAIMIDRKQLWRMSADAGAVFYNLTCRMSTSKPSPDKPDHDDVLLRGIFDIKVDAADVEHASHFPPPCKDPYWPGFGGYANFHPPGYQWPVPGWPTCYDWERLVDAWNRALVRLRDFQRAPQYELAQHQQIIDAYMYWLLLSVTAIFRDEEVRVPVEFNPELDPFVNDTRRVLSERPQVATTSRVRAYDEWCDALLLFFTPESGISKRLASELRNVGGPLDQKKPLLQKIRVERARASGIHGAEVNYELLAIDHVRRDHPWVQVFGPHTAL